MLTLDTRVATSQSLVQRRLVDAGELVAATAGLVDAGELVAATAGLVDAGELVAASIAG